MSRQATILVVAGLDPSGGAGLLADVLVVGLNGLHPAGVVTALTEQDSTECARMHPVSAAVIASQLERLVDDVDVRGVKVGMLASAEVTLVVARALRRLAEAQVPIVVDPVLRATRGVPLLEGTASRALAPVLELATVVTPNLDELAQLTSRTVQTPDDMREAARCLRGTDGNGPHAVLAKGGHLAGAPLDLLVDAGGELSLPGARIAGPTPHGTGCALSTELACRLATGTPLREAARAATERVRARIAGARTVGRGRPFLG